MRKLLIFTAEPSNFVPKELLKAAQALGREGTIVDVTHLALCEGLDGNSPETMKRVSTLLLVSKGEEEHGPRKVEELKVDAETVVIPRLNEHHLDVKLSMLKRMQDEGATLLNSVDSMNLCNDKLMTHVVLNTAGIKSPYSFTVSSCTEDIESVIDHMEQSGRLKYPCVIKTLRGTHGIGVMKIESRSSLVSVAQTLQKENLDFIVQEFMEHDKSARMIMIGDSVLASNLRGQPKDKGEFRTNSHLGSETEPYTPGEDEVALGRRIVELFGCKFCAIDYLVRESEGAKELVILEVNGSPGLENIQKNWPDKNLADEVVRFALGCPAVDAPNLQQTPNVSPETAAEVTPEAPEPNETMDLENVIQEVESVTVHRITPEPVLARVDTGAKYSSLHADSVTFDESWTKFTRGDVTFKVSTDRVIKIKNVHGGESTRRALVRLDVTVKGRRLNGVEFTINDRQQMKYEVLIGRNVLEQLGLPVLVPANPESGDRPESEIYNVEEE